MVLEVIEREYVRERESGGERKREKKRMKELKTDLGIVCYLVVEIPLGLGFDIIVHELRLGIEWRKGYQQQD